jgi:very-short-patch-repair endonuclease
MQISNIKTLKEYRRFLRNNLTPAEALLWKTLQSRQLLGVKFRRQHSIGIYILDFYCPKYRLGIELDGSVHLETIVMENDQVRTSYLNSVGIHVLRFDNEQILHDLDSVTNSIAIELKQSKPAF